VAGSDFDTHAVEGVATLNGALDVRHVNGFIPIAGQVFEVLSTTGGIVGNFSQIMLPSIPGGLQWGTLQSSTALSLFIGIPGDYNLDGVVNTADYVVWRKTNGQQNVIVGQSADGNRDGRIDDLDYGVWKFHFGELVDSASLNSQATVPEPAPILLVGIISFLMARHRFKCPGLRTA
jgi:hypothetical protein